VLRQVLAEAALKGLEGGLDADQASDPRFAVHNHLVPEAASPVCPGLPTVGT